MIDLSIVQKAIELTREGEIEEAEKIYTKLLEENPDNAVLLSTVGLFYVDIQNFEKGSEYLKKACELKETAGTLSALGFAEYMKNDYLRASITLEKALRYGDDVNVYDKLITSLFEIKDYNKAVKYAEKMYELFPENNYTVINRIKALAQSGKLREAEEFCIENLKKNPDNPQLWIEQGLLKELIYRDDKLAIECYKAALSLGNISAYYNIAVCYTKLGNYEEAEKYYKIMHEISPKNMNNNLAYGMCLLTQKKFKEGYNLFFTRNCDFETNNPWKPSDKLEDEILIFADQGYGDNIQFIRYLPFLKDKKVCCIIRDPLKDLFKRNYPQTNFISYSEADVNMQCIRITDLAYVLNMDFDNIPFSEGYLDVEPAKIESGKLKVGLCWEAGAAGIRTMINRTIHVSLFEPFFNMKNIQLYSFQYTDTFGGNEKYPQMINLAKDFKDFTDTARALKGMDVLITVDTSTAHLAGALGVKTYLLLPYVTDWRWFNDTETTPWYKSVRIFKQTDPISWEEPFRKIQELLNNTETE